MVSRHSFRRLALLLFLLSLPGLADAKEKLADRLQPLIDSHKGEVGVMMKHLDTGETFAHRENEPMSTASLIKFPVMIAAYQAIEDGKIKLEDRITLKEEDKVPGSVLTNHFSGGANFSLYDTIHLMITESDNTATNLVIDQVGLPTTAELMKSLGCSNTVLHSKVYRRDTSIFPKRSNRFGLGSTCAADMVKLLEMLHKGELVNKSACKKMAAHMLACTDDTKIERLLPDGVKFFHKTGAVNACRTDAGIIQSPHGPIALCVLTDKNEDRSWTNNNAAEILCARIGKEIYDYFNADTKVAEDESSKVLKLGANGLLVESLQRTLNVRLNPSPGLSVDGDFGPMTQQAVIAFQKFKQLKEKGEVGPETWKALGTLVAEGAGIPEPSVVNSAVLEKSPADDLGGPPFVTCKAWAIGDGNTGELLWGYNENQPRHMASTTKIMTGFLVTSLAELKPEVLDETVVFSKRADATIGSSSGVRAGEKISVKELLYGLLLPSGNDASVALAEHFGPRLMPDAEGDSYQKFVAAMNKKAEELGLKNSHFTNTHGLTEKKHQNSPADLMKLSYHAMQQPLFRKIVGTSQRGVTVVGLGGYKRNIKWTTTNRLLKIEGYEGVKTGTTSAAGSCLVSQATRGDRSLIVVVLGSAATDARYADSKNLYRWAWRQLGFGENTSGK